MFPPDDLEVLPTRSARRYVALIAALRDGPLPRAELLKRLELFYPRGDSGRRMLDRDVATLAELGICIWRSRDRPPVYTLRGGVPAWSDDELDLLALIRDSFGPRHPQAERMRALLARLVADLTPAQRRRYERHPALRMALQPAIDYAPYRERIDRLQSAINAGRRLWLRYRNTAGDVVVHEQIEPHAIEYYERHFYLVAYSLRSGAFHDFRIDRILDLRELEHLPPLDRRERPLITFRYRLSATLAGSGVSQRFEEQRILQYEADGAVVIEARARSEFWVIQTLLRYRAHAELLWPPELRARMIAEITLLAERYGLGLAPPSEEPPS
ncbi:helix-turn-helix transcriptional regulator [Kallotenue papyrolyticum]|uniref:helix-turn-helix transcriptional regulator n=1 Tax=Kallotenue papyrolyticum TaxID=1325125 RepID=UPI00049249C3|nr:WYL domain-containing protein [Kallotenue papyrolyticum]